MAVASVLLAIAGVLGALALPGYRDWIADSRLRGQSEALAATLNRARSAAMRSGAGSPSAGLPTERPALPRAAGNRAGWSSSTKTATGRATPTK